MECFDWRLVCFLLLFLNQIDPNIDGMNKEKTA